MGVGTLVWAGVGLAAGPAGEWGTFTVRSVDCSKKYCTYVGDFGGVRYSEDGILLGNGDAEDAVDEKLDAWYVPGDGEAGVAYKWPWVWWFGPTVKILIGVMMLVSALEAATGRLRFEAPARALPDPSEDD